MSAEFQRQRVARFEMQRERYLRQRQRTIQTTLAPGRALLTTRNRCIPILLVTPFAVLAVAGVLDLLFLLTGNGQWTTLSFAMIPSGVIGSIGALAVGLCDWFAAPAGSRVRGVGAWFAIGTTLVVIVFTQSWFARFGIASDAGGVGVVLGYMGSAVALLTGWLLGEYLDRLSKLELAAPANPVAIERTLAPQRLDEIVEPPRVAHA